MKGPIANLDADTHEQLLADLNYLNLSEIRAFCHRHGIPTRIMVERPDGTWKKTSDPDRKPVVLDRVRHYLKTGEVRAATRLPARIVRSDAPPDDLKPSDRIFYRWYNKTYQPVMDMLAELTDGRFRNGALARVLINEYWTDGQAPTFEEFAAAWMEAEEGGRDLLRREYAYLTDLREGRTGPDWKKVRKQKAEQAIAILDELSPP